MMAVDASCWFLWPILHDVVVENVGFERSELRWRYYAEALLGTILKYAQLHTRISITQPSYTMV